MLIEIEIYGFNVEDFKVPMLSKCSKMGLTYIIPSQHKNHMLSNLKHPMEEHKELRFIVA